MNIIYLVIGVLIGGITILLLGFAGVSPFTYPFNAVSGWVKNFDFQQILSNPATILTIAGSAAAVAIPLINKLNSAKQQVQQVAQSAQTQIGTLSSDLSLKTTNLENASANLEEAKQTITSLAAKAEDAAKIIPKLEQEKHDLLIQLEAFNNVQARSVVLAENKEVVRTVVR